MNSCKKCKFFQAFVDEQMLIIRRGRMERKKNIHERIQSFQHLSSSFFLLSFLEQAAQNGHREIVKTLLLSGANFAAVNNQGANALRHARIGNSLEIKVILTKHISQLSISIISVERFCNSIYIFSSSSARITLAMEREVMELLKKTATISHALFPMQCHSTVVNLHFRLKFNFHRSQPPESGK